MASFQRLAVAYVGWCAHLLWSLFDNAADDEIHLVLEEGEQINAQQQLKTITEQLVTVLEALKHENHELVPSLEPINVLTHSLNDNHVQSEEGVYRFSDVVSRQCACLASTVDLALIYVQAAGYENFNLYFPALKNVLYLLSFADWSFTLSDDDDDEDDADNDEAADDDDDDNDNDYVVNNKEDDHMQE